MNAPSPGSASDHNKKSIHHGRGHHGNHRAKISAGQKAYDDTYAAYMSYAKELKHHASKYPGGPEAVDAVAAVENNLSNLSPAMKKKFHISGAPLPPGSLLNILNFESEGFNPRAVATTRDTPTVFSGSHGLGQLQWSTMKQTVQTHQAFFKANGYDLSFDKNNNLVRRIETPVLYSTLTIGQRVVDIDQKSGRFIDAATKQPLKLLPDGRVLDPSGKEMTYPFSRNKEPVRINKTGQLIDAKGNVKRDPTTNKPLDFVTWKPVIDPKTGKPQVKVETKTVNDLVYEPKFNALVSGVLLMNLDAGKNQATAYWRYNIPVVANVVIDAMKKGHFTVTEEDAKKINRTLKQGKVQVGDEITVSQLMIATGHSDQLGNIRRNHPVWGHNGDYTLSQAFNQQIERQRENPLFTDAMAAKQFADVGLDAKGRPPVTNVGSPSVQNGPTDFGKTFGTGSGTGGQQTTAVTQQSTTLVDGAPGGLAARRAAMKARSDASDVPPTDQQGKGKDPLHPTMLVPPETQTGAKPQHKGRIHINVKLPFGIGGHKHATPDAPG